MAATEIKTDNCPTPSGPSARAKITLLTIPPSANRMSLRLISAPCFAKLIRRVRYMKVLFQRDRHRRSRPAHPGIRVPLEARSGFLEITAGCPATCRSHRLALRSLPLLGH